MLARMGAAPIAVKALIAVLFASLFFLGFPAVAAHADDPVDVTVNVTTKAGTPLAGLAVYAYPVQNHAVVGDGIVANYISGKKYTFSQANGNELDDETEYAFYFDAPSNATTAFDQFLGGTTFVEEATYWQYVTNQTTLDVTLATNSTLTGKVTGVSSKVVSGVAVYPWRFDGNDWYRLDDAKATTASTGVYTMRNLEPGTYRLEFVPRNSTGYLSEFSGNTRTFANAAALTVGLGATVAHNAVLATGGSISGKVKLTDVSLGGAVQPYGITAFAFPVLPGGAIDTSIAYPSNETTSLGTWTIKGLPAGTYKVKMYDTLDPNAPVFVDKWAIDKDTAATANSYVVTVGKTTSAGTTTMPFYLDAADTSLVVDIDDRNGNPASDATEVYIVSNSGEDFSAHFLLQGGSAYFPFLPVGGYDIFVDPHNGADGSYIGTRTIASGTANTWDIDLTAPSSFFFTAPPTIANGATKVGSTYSVSAPTTSFDPDLVEYTYIWLRDDAPIFGSQSSTSSTYTSRGVDDGHKISVIVRADAFGYAPIFATIVAADPVTVGDAPVSDAGNPPTVLAPAAPVAGSVLTAKVGSWNSAGLTFDYQWYSAGIAVPGATARTFTVRPQDAGNIISFYVYAHRVGHLLGAAESANTATIGYLAAPKLTKSSTFTVASIVDGIRATATAGTWSPAPTSLTYDWKIGGVEYLNAGSTFECVAPACAGSGLSIELRVTAKRTGYVDAVKNYLVRKGTALPTLDTSGFVYDFTDGGHPSFDLVTDPAFVGHTLKPSNPVYSYPNGHGGTQSRSYLWQRKIGTTWASIAGATKSSYVVTTADVNRELRLITKTASSLYPTVTEVDTAGTGALRKDLVYTHPDPYISGTPNTGTVKTALLTGAWPTSGVTAKYQWYVCNPATAVDCSITGPGPDWKPISKATSTAYRPATALAGQHLLVQISGSKTGYLPVSYRSSPIVLDDSPLEVTYVGSSSTKITAGIIGGEAAVGRTLTAKPGTTDRTTGVTHVYEWQICDGPGDSVCSGIATGLSVTPDVSWIGSYGPDTEIRFVDKVSLNGAPAFNGPSPRYLIVPGTNVPKVAPTVTNSGGTTPTYTVKTGTWTASSFGIVWYVGGTMVTSGTSYQPTPGTTPLVVEVTANRTGYDSRTFTLVARKGTLPTQPTVITGGTRFGDTLVAPGFSAPSYGASVVAKYQWYSGTTAIKGKTTNTFVPSSAYVGKALKVKVTLTSPYWNTKSYYTSAITLGSHLAATGTPVIVSTLAGNAPGSKLTVNTSSFPAGMTYTYLWERSTNGTTWTTAGTASSLVVPTSDVTKQIRVKVVAKKTGWANSAQITSAPVTVSHSPALALSGPFILGGSGKVDSPLTASTAWNTSGYVVTYTWTRNGVAIPGAIGTSVTPTASWVGDEIQAHATASKAGHLPVTVHSNEVRVANAPAPIGTGFVKTPSVPRTTDTVTVTPGVWNVAGLTFEFTWYAVSDNTHSTPLHTGATWVNPPADSYTVLVETSRAGYESATAGVFVQVQP